MKQYIYHVKGTLSGTITSELFNLIPNQGDDKKPLSAKTLARDYEHCIKQLLQEDDSDLSEYLDDDVLMECIKSIRVGVDVEEGKLWSDTVVISSRELTEEEQIQLIDFLSGQFSDGYGEGIEQRSFADHYETVITPDWDEYDECFILDDEQRFSISCYVHLWQTNNFTLEFDDEVEIKDITLLDVPCEFDYGSEVEFEYDRGKLVCTSQVIVIDGHMFRIARHADKTIIYLVSAFLTTSIFKATSDDNIHWNLQVRGETSQTIDSDVPQFVCRLLGKLATGSN